MADRADRGTEGRQPADEYEAPVVEELETTHAPSKTPAGIITATGL
jgi:hypothetical protein